jgi:hypothetical protein
MGFKEVNLEIHRIIFILLIILLLISSRYKDYFKNYKLLLNLFLVFVLQKNISYGLIMLLMNINIFSAD